MLPAGNLSQSTDSQPGAMCRHCQPWAALSARRHQSLSWLPPLLFQGPEPSVSYVLMEAHPYPHVVSLYYPLFLFKHKQKEESTRTAHVSTIQFQQSIFCGSHFIYSHPQLFLLGNTVKQTPGIVLFHHHSLILFVFSESLFSDAVTENAGRFPAGC